RAESPRRRWPTSARATISRLLSCLAVLYAEAAAGQGLLGDAEPGFRFESGLFQPGTGPRSRSKFLGRQAGAATSQPNARRSASACDSQWDSIVRNKSTAARNSARA